MRIDKKVDFGKNCNNQTFCKKKREKKRERGDKKTYFIEHLIINPVLYVLTIYIREYFYIKLKLSRSLHEIILYSIGYISGEGKSFYIVKDI